jgi:hypothetical protein
MGLARAEDQGVGCASAMVVAILAEWTRHIGGQSAPRIGHQVDGDVGAVTPAGAVSSQRAGLGIGLAACDMGVS